MKKRLSFWEALEQLSQATDDARQALIRDYPIGCQITYRQGSRRVLAEVVEHHDFMIGLTVRGLISGKTYRLDPRRITSPPHLG